MKIGLAIAAVAIVLATAFGVYMVDIDQTQQAELPNVEIEGGQLPEFSAETGDISITEEEVTVTVPDIEITPPQDEEIASN